MLLKEEKLGLFFVPFLINSLFGRFELDPPFDRSKNQEEGFLFCFGFEFLVGSRHFFSFFVNIGVIRVDIC